MIKKLIPLILFWQIFFSLQITFGQSQTDIPNYIRQRFQNYFRSVPAEEIFVHTDRDEYISGEDIWFNIYLIDKQRIKSSANSRIACFEILNAVNRPVLQKRILLENGFGPGQVLLPDTLSSGSYTLRVYTSWMKNFLPNGCFMKEIRIYNPLKDDLYKRGVRSMDIIRQNPVADESDTGFFLEINNLRQDSLEIYIHSDEKFRSETNYLIYILIQTHGIINHLSIKKIPEDVAKISIPKNSLTPGINQITIFDEVGPVADRLIFTPEREKQIVTLHSNDTFSKREKVALDIHAGDGLSGIANIANLSISVSYNTETDDADDITDYFLTGTEYGLFPWSTFRGKKITDLSPELMDTLLLSAKSNRIDWLKIFSDEVTKFKYPQESDDHYISGVLFSGNMHAEFEDEILLISIPGKDAAFQYTRTEIDGSFNFRVHIDDEVKDIIIQPDLDRKGQIVQVESSFSDKYLPVEVIIDTVENQVQSGIARQSIGYQVRNIFGTSQAGEVLPVEATVQESKRFYGKPDFELIMKNFIKLDSMQEVFFELVPHVTLDNINNVYELSISDPSRIKLEGIPCIMIDGVIVKDLSVIANLNPELVEKIDVVWNEYRIGGYLFNGIVNIISKKGDFSSVALPSDAVRLHYRVFDPVHSFISPDYSTSEMKNSRVADYRNTLYWNPSVKPDKNGTARIEFWTGDIKSEYIISVQGITSDGKVFSARKSITIR